ncbi:MAG: cyanophycin synthetase [Sulfitobacter sp.]|jgi:UDP-N-acetylmuramyl tripeptide synthase
MSSPGAILDLQCDPDEVPQVIESWQRAIQQATDSLRWENTQYASRVLTGGVSLAFSAPIDSLYAASEVNQWAYQCIEAESKGQQTVDFSIVKAAVEKEFEDETNSQLLALQAAAIRHGVTLLWDDDEVSLGLGSGSKTWPVTNLPIVDDLNWSSFFDVPIGIVTGTNGKTTTARLARFILQNSGMAVGVSCTDWIAVNNEIIDRGDWSGPGGARAILRRTDVTTAILETARGGLLRRGLGVERADAAVITNIAADHLGDFGSRNLKELLDIKWVVSHAADSGGVLILNADDPLLVEKSQGYRATIVWFSLVNDNPVVVSHLAAGGLAFVLCDKDIMKLEGDQRDSICHVGDVPITMAGAARHNVANALAAAALTHAMGVSLADIASGLLKMTQHDNPGRCNLYERADIRVLVDFAHNPHAIKALFEMASALPAQRRLLAFAQAGDRPDPLIREMAAEAWSIGLDRVLVSELAHYHRGREHGEVFEIINDKLLELGARPDQVGHFELETEALAEALSWAQSGDLVIMLALDQRDEVQSMLQAQLFKPAV